MIALLLIALIALSGCYKCRTPDCRELPPGPDYPAATRDAGAG